MNKNKNKNINANTVEKVSSEIEKVSLTKNLSWHPSLSTNNVPGVIVVKVDGDEWNVDFGNENDGKFKYVASCDKVGASFDGEITSPTKEQINQYCTDCWRLNVKILKDIESGLYVKVENAFAFASTNGDWTINAHKGVLRGREYEMGELVLCGNDGLVGVLPSWVFSDMYYAILGSVPSKNI